MKKFLPVACVALVLCACQSKPTVHGSLLASLQQQSGENPESFSYGPCLYLEGADGDIAGWKNYGKKNTRLLETLLSQVPTAKLDYPETPKNASDRIIIGPLCTCPEVERVRALVADSGLDFSAQIFKGTDELQGCLEAPAADGAR